MFDDMKEIAMPFATGWLTLMMFDLGDKIKRIARNDLLLRVTLAVMIVVAYVKDIRIALAILILYGTMRHIVSMLIANCSIDYGDKDGRSRQ